MVESARRELFLLLEGSSPEKSTIQGTFLFLTCELVRVRSVPSQGKSLESSALGL